MFNVFITILICLTMLIYFTDKPQYSAVLICTIISISPIIREYLSDKAYFIFIGLVLAILVLNLIKDKLFNKFSLLLFFMAIVYILMQYIFIGLTISQVITALFRFVIIPHSVFYSAIYMKKKNLNISHVLLLFFIINLFIVYYRIYFDYSFFGVIDSYKGTIYEKFYEFNGINFRPYNLVSEIAFSIELVVYLIFYHYENGNSKGMIILGMLSIIPLYYMRSRSSFIILLIYFVYLFIKSKSNYKYLVILPMMYFVYRYFDQLKDIVQVLNFTEPSYFIRFQSIFNSIQQFFDSSLVHQLFGYGTGFANTEFIKGEGFKLYVENFHLSVLYDSGPLIFTMWMVFNIAVIYENIIKSGRMPIAIIIFGFVLINLFSSNLTNYTTQVIYWSVIFQIITWNYKKSKKVNIIGEYHE